MTTKLTAAQLRGLKAEKEKENRNNAIAHVCNIVYGNIILNAEKGHTKYSIYLIDGENAPGVWNYKVNEEFITDCCSILQEQYIDCIVEMEEIPAEKYKKAYNQYMITIDWSKSTKEEKPKDEVISDPMKSVLPKNEVVSEIEILRIKVAKLEEEKVSDKLEIKNLHTKLNELEKEISKLKSSNSISTVTQMTTDLLDILTGFGKIVESDVRTNI